MIRFNRRLSEQDAFATAIMSKNSITMDTNKPDTPSWRRVPPLKVTPLFALRNHMSGTMISAPLKFGLDRHSTATRRATYANVGYKFFDVSAKGVVDYRLRNVNYYVSAGFVGEKIAPETYYQGEGYKFCSLLFKPLLLVGVLEQDLEYVVACIRAGRQLDPKSLVAFIDPEVDTPNTKYKGARFLLNKHLRSNLEGVDIQSKDLSNLFPKARFPNFKSRYQKELTLRKVSNRILEDIEIE